MRLFLRGLLVGVALAVAGGWLWSAEWRRERALERERSARTDEFVEIQSAEIARLDAELLRERAVNQTPDTIRLPDPRPRPVTPPGYADPAAEVARLAALADTLWAEGEQLRARIGRDSVRLAAYGRLTAIRDTQVALLTAQRDTLQADRDRWRSLAERAPVGAPRLPPLLTCAAGALAGAVAGDALSDRPAVVLGAAGVGCLLPALLR